MVCDKFLKYRIQLNMANNGKETKHSKVLKQGQIAIKRPLNSLRKYDSLVSNFKIYNISLLTP